MSVIERSVRFSLLILCSVLLLSGCLTQPSKPEAAPGPEAANDGKMVCAEPRPKICTMIYQPVCANLLEGGIKEYASACNACADVAVTSYKPDACEVKL